MYVLGINASPRVGGNTDKLLDKALEGSGVSGAKTEKIILNKLKISPCQECPDMPSVSPCLIEDDMREVYKKVRDADILIFASPIFFGSLTAQAKIMVDRFQCIWRAKYMFKNDAFADKKRIGAFICVEASDRRDFFANAKAIVKNLFATINTQYKDELFCCGIDEKGMILKHPDYLNEAFEIGKKMPSERRKDERDSL